MIGTLEHIVSQMNINGGTFTFEYGKRGYVNVLDDDLLLPAVIYDTESIFNLTPSQSGYIGEGGRAILSFMYKSELEWTPKQHYDNCIEPAINAARQFISLCQASELIEEISVGDGREFINLLDKNTSGIQFPFSIKLRVDKNVCVNYTPADNCQPVILTINGVEVETILSGAVFPLNITLNGTPSGTYNEATDTWEVESEPCADATYTIKDRDENTLYSGSIASGGDLTQYIENTTVEVNNTYFADVPSQGSLNIPVLNEDDGLIGTIVGTDVIISNSYISINGTVLQSVLAEDSQNINVFNSNSENVGLSNSGNWEVGDSSITVNGNAYNTIKSEGTLDVAVEYENGTPVGTIVSGVVEIPNPVTPSGIAYQRPQLTGQVTSYRTGDAYWRFVNMPYAAAPSYPTSYAKLVDIVTLSSNNAFGNTFRFTDQAGNKAINYPMATSADLLTMDTLIDHYTGLEWGINDKQTGNNKNWETAIDECLALNVRGFDDWYLPDIQEWLSVTDFNGNGLGLNVIFALGSRNHWSSNTDFLDTAQGVQFSITTSTTNMINRTAKTTNRNYYPVRQRY